MGSRAWLGGGDKLSRGHGAVLFIGLGVLAHAEQCLGDDLQQNQRSAPSSVRIVSILDSRSATVKHFHPTQGKAAMEMIV
jgi:hypothetical protein